MDTVSVRHRAPRYPGFIRSVEAAKAAQEFKRALLAPFISARYGRRTSVHLSNLAKDVSRDQNRAAFTVIDLLFGAQDMGVDVDTLCHAPSTLEALITVRAPETTALTEAEIHRMETKLEGDLNDVQMAYVTGDNSTQCQMKLLAQIDRNLAVLEKMKARVVQNLYGQKS